MKIIEAMKELKLIEKKLKRNREQITQYASQPSNEKPYFKDEQEARPAPVALDAAAAHLLVGELRVDDPAAIQSGQHPIHRDPARPDSNDPSRMPSESSGTNYVKTIYNTRREKNITNIEVSGEVRSHSHFANDRTPQSQAASPTEIESEPPLSSKAYPVLMPTIESLSQPVWPLHPRRQPDPQQGSHQRQDNGTTVEIGSVIIETVKTSATPKRPAVPPHGQRRKRPGPMRSELRDNRRHQKSVSRLKYGLGAL